MESMWMPLLGGAGHSEYLLSQLSEKGHLYAFDQDQHAIDNAEKRLAPYVDKGMVTFIKDNFPESSSTSPRIESQ